jgi:hypothetical protein
VQFVEVRSLAQAVRSWLLASVAPVRFQDWSCAIRGGSFPSSGSQTLASCLSGPRRCGLLRPVANTATEGRAVFDD